MNNQQQTPLEKLRADKARLETACSIQAEKLDKTLAYMQENAGSLLISGLSSLLFPPKAKGKAQQTPQTENENPKTPVAISTADYLSMAKSLWPVAWEIAQPLLVNWGIRKARRWLVKLFSSRKK